MSIFRRRLPSELADAYARFGEVAAVVERAKAAVLASVPTTRMAGRPLAETLLEFESELATAASLMDGWRAAEIAEVWEGARVGLADARALAERLRLEAATPVGFEQLVGTIGDLLAPLDAFIAADERFRSLRRRG